jgi:hypothetical protein
MLYHESTKKQKYENNRKQKNFVLFILRAFVVYAIILYFNKFCRLYEKGEILWPEKIIGLKPPVRNADVPS